MGNFVPAGGGAPAAHFRDQGRTQRVRQTADRRQGGESFLGAPDANRRRRRSARHLLAARDLR